MTTGLRVCAEKDCETSPTLRVEIADGVGEYDIAFGCSEAHLSTFMRATQHLVEGWFPFEFTRAVRPLAPDEVTREAGTGTAPLR